MAEYGYATIQPLPNNRRAWSAFLRVCHVRHYPMGQKHLPNWSDIASVLTTYNLWDSDIHGRLSVCFTELMTLEGETEKAENG